MLKNPSASQSRDGHAWGYRDNQRFGIRSSENLELRPPNPRPSRQFRFAILRKCSLLVPQGRTIEPLVCQNSFPQSASAEVVSLIVRLSSNASNTARALPSPLPSETSRYKRFSLGPLSSFRSTYRPPYGTRIAAR